MTQTQHHEPTIPPGFAIGSIGAVERSQQGHERLVTIESRAIANGHRGAALWLTGLPGSGKSTLARRLERELFKRGRQVFVLESDELRQGISRGLGFTPSERIENDRRLAEVARLFIEAGLVVIVAATALKNSERALARDIIGASFREIFLKCDIATSELRGRKAPREALGPGSIADISEIARQFETPVRPDLTIDTAAASLDEATTRLVAFVDGHAAPLAPVDAWAI